MLFNVFFIFVSLFFSNTKIISIFKTTDNFTSSKIDGKWNISWKFFCKKHTIIICSLIKFMPLLLSKWWCWFYFHWISMNFRRQHCINDQTTQKIYCSFLFHAQKSLKLGSKSCSSGENSVGLCYFFYPLPPKAKAFNFN